MLLVNVLVSSFNVTSFINKATFYSLGLIMGRLSSFEVVNQFVAIYIKRCVKVFAFV